MPLLSKIPYASVLQYSVRGTTPDSRRSKDACHQIKFRAHPGLLKQSASITSQVVAKGDPMAEFFGPDVLLVPAPGHAPMPKKPGQVLWVPKMICDALLAEKLAGGVEPCVERHTAVTKSATSGRHAKRDALVHYESMGIIGMQFGQPSRITIVDDVVTTGATLLASASRIQEAFPDSDVRCFGLISPISDGEVQRTVSPHTGTIVLSPGNTTYRT